MLVTATFLDRKVEMKRLVPNHKLDILVTTTFLDRKVEMKRFVPNC